MKPLIIISPSISEDLDEIKLSRACFESVERAGGIGLAADYSDAAELADLAQGILLSGGGDLEPSLTGDEPDEEHQGFICGQRDAFELELVKEAIKRGIPLLGICRGMQVLAAAFGGNVIQHFEGHRQTGPKNETSHHVDIDENSMLYRIIGKKRLEVNSFHHQAAGEKTELKISARSGDGYIEAVEGRGDSFVMGIQWHPEFLCGEHEKIFKAFVEAAGRYKICCGK